MRRYSTVVKRLKENYKQHKKIISYGLEQRFNEASTTDIVEDVVEKSLGFDRFMDRHAQLAVDERGKEIVDIVLQFSNYQIPIEIKAITSKMTKNHIIQLSAYCKLIGSHYGILTNGVQWRLYHYGEDREEPIPISRLDFEQDSLERVIDQLYFLSKESFEGGHTAKRAEYAAALNAKHIANALLSKRVLSAVRLEMQERHGCSIDNEDVEEVLLSEVIRANLMELKPED